MTINPLRAFVFALLAAALACSPGSPGVTGDNVTTPVEATAPPTLEGVPSLKGVDFQDPPAWLEDILAGQPSAPEPDPIQLQFQVNTEKSAARSFGERGGKLELQGSDGVTYTLEIPKGALLSELDITMTQVRSVGDAEADGESLAAVELKPEGLVLLQPAVLRVELPSDGKMEGYLGFSAAGAGENGHAATAVVVDGTLELNVQHFSMHGMVSGRHSNNARLLYAAIRNSTPNGAANYYKQDLAQVYADWQDGKLSLELFTQIMTQDKREWFWRKSDGVYYSLLDGAVRTVDSDTNLIEEPYLLERAIAHYVEWNHIQRLALRDYFVMVGGGFPFELEEALANRLITQGIKEGLEAECRRPIDALYKIRMYRLGLALQSSSSAQGVNPYSATSFPDFTQAYALEKVQACANFKLDYTTYLALQLPDGPWEETGIVKKLPYVFGEKYEVEVFSFRSPAEQWQGRNVACETQDGFITFSDLRWPLNIFGDPDLTFQQHPLQVRLKVVQAPTVTCGALPLPPYWVLHRLLTCPLRFDMDVVGLIDRPHTDFIKQFECEFTDPEGNAGVVRDELFLDHDPQVSIFD